MFDFIMGCLCGKETIHVEGSTYITRGKLGEGGFSLVTLVENSRTHKLHAMKRILCHSRADVKIAEREIEYMRVLHECPNLIRLTASFQEQIDSARSSVQSRVYIIMPYYQIGSLQDLIDKQRLPEQDKLVGILLSLCDCIQYLHERKPSLHHRDIKPANVLLTDDLSPVLMDLGSMSEVPGLMKSSRDAQTLQDETAERCSMPYRAPELFNIQSGDLITTSTDMWSLGCLIYACIYGEAPFDSIYQKGGSIALAAVGGNVQYPEQDNYAYQLVEICQFCLRVNPQQRSDIKNVITKLETLSDKLTVTI